MDRFIPRYYQVPIINALERDGYKKILCILPRRAGKDLVAWNMMIWQAIQQVGVYFYCLPTYKQAKLVIWNSITNDGTRFTDYIPPQLIRSTNSQELKIELTNGSIIQLIGSDSYDRSLVGTNPKMLIFSEYALADERAYHFVRPILNANNGTVIFLSTPRGQNHLYELYNIAKDLDDWFVLYLTLDDTKHISKEQIDKEIASGEVSWDLAQQEYWCSFSMGVAGAYFAKYIDDLRLKDRITIVPWHPDHPVHTAWDIGVRDSTVIIYFQYFDNLIRIIECYDNDKEGLEHYIKEVKSKPYIYGTHIAPHDMKVKEFGTGMTRMEKAANLGIQFTIAPHLPIQDGIEAVRTMLPFTTIDQNCKTLIKALEHYRQEFDHKKKVYKSHPAHTWESHFADAIRYLALSYKRLGKEVTPEDLDELYRKAHQPQVRHGRMFR